MVMALCSYSQLSSLPTLLAAFWEVLVSWDCPWICDHVQLVGNTYWLNEVISTSTCIAVADGSYMREVTTDVCTTAFFIENTSRTCKLVGAFPKRPEMANAYHGELLGLMSVHLVLLAVNKVAPGLAGSITIYSDCECAIKSIESLPALKIPTHTNTQIF